MNPCDDCPIDDKIYECCGRFPETGETVYLQITRDRFISACPHLKPHGTCGIYKNRPYACQTHLCYRYDAVNNIGAGYQILKNQWGNWWEEDT